MFIEILTALLIGVIAGIITGLIPGIHVNLISLLLLSISASLLNIIPPFAIGAFIIAMATTHTFIDSLPSIYLGAPDADQVLGVLPGHKLLLKGKGHYAIRLTIIGSLIGLILAIIIIPFLVSIIQNTYDYIAKFIAYILIVVVIWMIWKESNWKKRLLALFQFILAGGLGLIILTWSNLSNPLFPLLSGLFGISTLLFSLNSNTEIPHQEYNTKTQISKKDCLKCSFISVITGGLVALLPGLGSAQAGIVGSQMIKNAKDDHFLVLVGGINTANAIVSLLTFHAINKARNGAIVVVKEIIKEISYQQMLGYLLVCLIAGCIATILALKLSKIFSKLIRKVNYKFVCWGVIMFVSVLVLVLSGIYGFIIMLVATFIGMIPTFTGVKKSMNMGCLLLPVICFFVL